MRRFFLGCGVAFSILASLASRADVGPPAHLRITERDPGLYTAQWRVPKVLPPRAVPVPALPETCRPEGDPTIEDQSGAWLFTGDWRCETSLAGQIVGMRYPFPDLALTTVARVELLSGDRFARLLTPGEESWRLPEGTTARDPLRDARRAVLSGVSHVVGSWVHVAFVVVVGLLGGFRRSVRVVSAFTVGQIAGAVVTRIGPATGVVPAEIGIAVVVALLAREVLRPEDERRALAALAATAGALHGLAIGAMLAPDLGDDASRIVVQLLAILGMDSTQLVGAAGVTALCTGLARGTASARVRTGVAYGAGTAGIALAIGLALTGGVTESGAASSTLTPPGTTATGTTAGNAGSRRVAPAVPDAPVQSFLVMEPFEVRHEIMVRLAGVAEEVGLDPASTIEIDSQSGLSERLAAWVVERVAIEIDGTLAPAFVRRSDFMKVDATGALPRTTPVPESVEEAVLGIIVAYPTTGMPQRVALTWDPFPFAQETLPATMIDPETVRTVTLSAGESSLTWENALAEDPVPTVAAVEVEPVMLPVPLLSLLPLGVIAVVLAAGIRRRRSETAVAAARVLLAVAIVVGPVAQTAIAIPGSAGRIPTEVQARRILAGLLPNIYRALEFREEAAIYDRLAVSVTGDTLTEVYLQQRRALEMEERGGAQVRVQAVEVLEAGEVESGEIGFRVRSIWTVGGMVTHFGHRHFRQNRYDARIGIVPVAGTWKIRSIEILEQDRVK